MRVLWWSKFLLSQLLFLVVLLLVTALLPPFLLAQVLSRAVHAMEEDLEVTEERRRFLDEHPFLQRLLNRTHVCLWGAERVPPVDSA